MRRSFVGSALALLLALSSGAAAQSVTGRVTDSLGNPVQHVRVLIHPMGDTTEQATRIAVTNVRGEFRVPLAGTGRYAVRARRIGFAAEPDRVVTIAGAELRMTITLRALAVALAPIRVVEVRDPRCVGIDDPEQNPLAREWLDHALYVLRTRRIVERDYMFKVHVAVTRTPVSRATDQPYTYTRHPGIRPPNEDDWSNIVGVARAVALRRSDNVMATETTLLAGTFLRAHCFVNAMTQNADGTWTLRFRGTTEYERRLTIAGALTFAPDGLRIAHAVFEFAIAGTVVSTAALAFDAITIAGETYPILSARSVSRLATKTNPRASSTQEWISYSGFVAAR